MAYDDVGGAGSPPPMRGKAWFMNSSPFSNRITPAYAGKSFCRSDMRICPKDHPRLCGEKDCRSADNVKRIRITPAYAGKSATGVTSSIVKKDHPRLCGEKLIALFPILENTGSPPPMRGKVGKLVADRVLRGITPAYAGKSGLHLPFPAW